MNDNFDDHNGSRNSITHSSLQQARIRLAGPSPVVHPVLQVHMGSMQRVSIIVFARFHKIQRLDLSLIQAATLAILLIFCFLGFYNTFSGATVLSQCIVCTPAVTTLISIPNYGASQSGYIMGPYAGFNEILSMGWTSTTAYTDATISAAFLVWNSPAGAVSLFRLVSIDFRSYRKIFVDHKLNISNFISFFFCFISDFDRELLPLHWNWDLLLVDCCNNILPSADHRFCQYSHFRWSHARRQHQLLSDLHSSN